MSSLARQIKTGNLTAVIRRHLAERGDWYSVQLKRGCKTEDGWRGTDNLGRDDLLAAKLLDPAHTWNMHRLAADARGRKPADDVTLKSPGQGRPGRPPSRLNPVPSRPAWPRSASPSPPSPS